MAQKATTWLDLANRALSRIGSDLIAAFDDGTPNANLVSLHYQAVYRELLGNADWIFARKRETLAALVDAPAFGFTYQYRLPVDFIRYATWEQNGALVPAIDCEAMPYRPEGTCILTDASSVSICYIAAADSAADLPESFARCYVARLASCLGTSVVKNEALRGILLIEAQDQLEKALAENQAPIAEATPSMDFLSSRRA